MTYPSFADCHKNLVNFIHHLDDTMIDILVLVRDGTTFKPTVKSHFKRWMYGTTEIFIVAGSTTNYCYIHPRSILEKFIYIIANDIKGYQQEYASIKKKHHSTKMHENKGVIYGPNHLTIGIQRMPTDRHKIQMRTHSTIYTEGPEPGSFNRRENAYCDFEIIQPIIQCHHEESLSEAYRRESTYIPIIQTLRNIIIGKESHQKETGYIQYGGTPFRIHRGGRGGKYIVKNNARIYLRQKGGMAYKGLRLLADVVVDYLIQDLFKPILTIRPDLETIQLFFDETNTLGSTSNQHLVLLYEFTHICQVFFIPSHTILAACYAKVNPTTATLQENKALETILQIRQTMLQQLSSMA